MIQPTFLDSRTINLPPDDPRVPDIWRQRVADLVSTLDHLDQILATVPGLAARVDSTRIAVAGHSFGGQTAGILLGLRSPEPTQVQATTLPTTESKSVSSWEPPDEAETP